MPISCETRRCPVLTQSSDSIGCSQRLRRRSERHDPLQFRLLLFSHGETKAHFTLSLETAVGAAYGTSKAGIGITGMGTMRPELIMKVRFLMLLRFQTLSSLAGTVFDPCCHERYHCSVWIGR